MAIFSWRAQLPTSATTDVAVLSSKFGDGYSQDMPDGLRPVSSKWTVVVSGKGPMIRDVLAFLITHKGMPFQWRAPNTTGLTWWKCKRWLESDEGGDYWTVTMDFEKANMP